MTPWKSWSRLAGQSLPHNNAHGRSAKPNDDTVGQFEEDELAKNLKALPQSWRSFAVMTLQLLDCIRRRGHLWPHHPSGPLSKRWPGTVRFSLGRTPSPTLFLAHGCRCELRVSTQRPLHRFRPYSACRSSTMPWNGIRSLTAEIREGNAQ